MLPEKIKNQIEVHLFGWALNQEYKTHLNQNINQYGLGGIVYTNAYTDNINATFARSDIVCCPTVEKGEITLNNITHKIRCKEGFGLSALEAMRAQKPVICSATGGLLEVVENKKTGLHVPQNDVTALARALETLITNKRAREEMGVMGYQRYKHLFNDKTMAKHFLEFIKQ